MKYDKFLGYHFSDYDIEGFDKRHLYNVFSEYMKSFMYRYRLKPDDEG